MSDHSHDHPPQPERFDLKDAGGLPTILLGAGVVGIVASLVGLAVPAWRAQFAYSWLFAFTYFFTIAIGTLFWTCLHHATDAEWSVVVRRILENVARLLPYFALFFIPLLFCAKILWKWWEVPAGDDPLLDAKQPYLSHWFFYLRIVVYFFLLGWIGWSLYKLSTSQDRDGAIKHTLIMRKFGIAGQALKSATSGSTTVTRTRWRRRMRRAASI